MSKEEMAQLFHDFNFKVVPVPARIAIALDTSDIYIRLTDKLAEECRAISEHGSMEKRSASLGKKSTALVVQQTLYRFVRGATDGEKFQESNREVVDRPSLTIKTFDDELDKLARFLEAFHVSMGRRWTDRGSLHLSSPGWQALGVIYHDLVHVLKVPDFEAAAAALARVDWSRTAPIWKDIIRARGRSWQDRARVGQRRCQQSPHDDPGLA